MSAANCTKSGKDTLQLPLPVHYCLFQTSHKFRQFETTATLDQKFYQCTSNDAQNVYNKHRMCCEAQL